MSTIDPVTAYANAHTRLMCAEDAFAKAEAEVEAAHAALAAARFARAEACRAFEAAETAFEAFKAAQNAVPKVTTLGDLMLEDMAANDAAWNSPEAVAARAAEIDAARAKRAAARKRPRK